MQKMVSLSKKTGLSTLERLSVPFVCYHSRVSLVKLVAVHGRVSLLTTYTFQKHQSQYNYNNQMQKTRMSHTNSTRGSGSGSDE